MFARYITSYAAAQTVGPHKTAVLRTAVEHGATATALAPTNDFALFVLGSAQYSLASALGADADALVRPLVPR